MYKLKYAAVPVLIFCLLFTGCTGGRTQNPAQGEQITENGNAAAFHTAETSIAVNDFKITAYAGQTEYSMREDFKYFAEVEYTGASLDVEIGRGPDFFKVNILEKDGSYVRGSDALSTDGVLKRQTFKNGGRYTEELKVNELRKLLGGLKPGEYYVRIEYDFGVIPAGKDIPEERTEGYIMLPLTVK